MYMKNWLSNILLFTSLFLFTPIILSGAENDANSKEASFSISNDNGHTVLKGSNGLRHYNFLLSKLSSCLLEKDLIERLRVPRPFSQEPTSSIDRRLICMTRALLPGTKLKKSFSVNHDSFVEMLFNKKYYIYGRKQIII